MTNILTVAIGCLFDERGRVLLVRKRGTQAFMLPGGKAEPGETPLFTLTRELEEELGVRLQGCDFRPLGRFEAPAANEPGFQVRADAFLGPTIGTVNPLAELDAMHWLDIGRPASIPLAPLFERHILPLLQAQPCEIGSASTDRTSA